MMAEKNWYVIYIKEHWEKKIIGSLARKKIETFLPLTKPRKLPGEKKSSPVYQPLFAQLLFVHIAPIEIPIIKQTEGVLHFLYWLEDYAVVNKSDIDAIRIFLNVYPDVWLEKTTVSSGQVIEIGTDGDFDMGRYSGHNKTDKIFLPTLGYFLVAQTEGVKEMLHRAI